MSNVDLRSIVGRLTPIARAELENAGGTAVKMTNFNVELEHWLIKLLERPSTDIGAILNHFGADQNRVLRDLVRAVGKLRTGSGRMPGLSPVLVNVTRDAWLIGSLAFGAQTIRSGHVLLAALEDETVGRSLRDAAPDLDKVKAEDLKGKFDEACAGSAEAQ
jgi:type VI secretion system protein VasG